VWVPTGTQRGTRRMALTFTVTVQQVDGWHARPATEFANLVAASGQQVSVAKAGTAAVRGDSVLSLMMLGAKCGETLEIAIDGSQPETLAAALKSLF